MRIFSGRLRRRLEWLWPARRAASARPSSARRRHRGATSLGIQQLEPKLALAVTPSLVFDINQTPQSSYPMNVTVMGDHAYFVADDGVHGQELWKTDGTPEGTTLVKDIFAGLGSSGSSALTVVGDKLFFTAFDELHGSELWVSDGTADGTQLVKDLATGEDPWYSSGPAGAFPDRLTPVGDAVYFTAYSGEMAPGMHYVQRRLWKTDGTASGTEMVVGGLETDPRVEDVCALGDVIVFSSPDAGSGGIAIWRVDGSAVEQLTVFPEAAVGSFTVAEGRAFFAVNSWTTGSAAWVTDGTAAGTLSLQSTGFNSVGGFTAVDAVVYFTTYAYDDESFTSEYSLWKTDGTPDGTEVVKGGFVSIWEPLAAVGGRLVFGADDGVNGRELWQSDGTEGGTTLLADLAPGELTLPFGSSEPLSGNPFGFTQRGEELYFFANNGELWKTDGTVDGTELVSDEIGEDDGSGAFGAMAVVGGDLVFRAGDEQFGIELWKSDGTAGGTELLLDIAPGTLDAWPDFGPRPVAAFLDGSIYFVANDGINGESLWMSDGTEDGTRLVRAALNDSSSSWSPPSEPYAFNGAVYFGAYDPSSGKELWKTDGTPAGTVMVADLASFTGGSSDDASSHPRGFTAVGDSLYFIADSEFGNASIWKTDGTEEGTEWVAAFGGYGGVNDLEAAGDRLFYVIPGLGNQLQFFDTVSGDFVGVEFTALDPTAYAEPSNLVGYDGLLYFVGDVGGLGLHAVPGDLPEGGLATLFTGSIGFLGVVGGWVYFAGDAGDGLGMHVYSTDGTFDGTSLADVPWLDVLADSAPLAVVGSRLYFPSRDADHGLELWTVILNDGSAPTDISLSAAAVAENAPVGTEVGTFTTTDADAGTTFTYALVADEGSDDNGLFTIEDGVLKTAAVFDFENKSSYSIRVQSTDEGGLSFAKTFAITVTNVAEPGGSFADAVDLVLDETGAASAEGTITSGGFTIYRIEIPRGRFFTAAASDAGGTDTLDTFVRVWNADEQQVAFNDDIEDSTNSLATIFVPGSGGTATYYIGVSGYPNDSYDPAAGTVPLSDSTSGDFTVAVMLTDEVNIPPTDLVLSDDSVLEEGALFVGAFYVDDANASSGDTFTVELVAGEGDADNDEYVVASVSSNWYLMTAPGFSVDADTVHSVRLQVVDAAGNTLEKVFEITVENNAAPTDIVLGSASVPGDSPDGTVVGRLNPSDPNAGDTFTFELVAGEGDTDNELYKVLRGYSIEFGLIDDLATSQQFAFTAETVHSVRLRVTDSGGNTLEKVFEINVTAGEATGPTVAITDDVAGIATGPVTFTFSFSEPVVGFSAGKVVVTGGTKGTLNEVNDKVYTLVVAPAANPIGPIVVSLAAGAVADTSGNPIAATSVSQEVQVKAVLGAAAPAGTVTEDAGVNAAGFLVATGTFTVVDPNPGEAAFKTTVATPAGVTNLGSLTVTAAGGFTYVVQNTLAGVQSLRVGETRTEVFTIESLDGTKLDVTFSIAGVADVLSGVVADGYLAGATIYADLNGNRIFDAGEPSTTTDSSGNFSFDFGSATATLVSIGGTDVSTGLPFAGSLTAPAGATVINPLTTVLTVLVEAAGPAADAAAHAAAVAAASSQVVAGLGLPNVNLTSFDPLAPAADPTAALKVQKAAASVANVIVVAITVGVNPAAVVRNIATAVTTVSTGQTVNLGDTTVITSIMAVPAVTGGAPVAPPAAAVGNVAQVNAQIAAAATINAIATLQTVVQSASAFISENAPAETIAYQATVPAGMVAPVFSLKDVVGDDKALVTIDAATGAVRLLTPANYETKSSYSFTVVASEDGQADVETTVTVGVSNVNEAPTDIALSGASVAENQPSGTAVGTLTTTDADTGSTFTYTLVSGEGSADNGSFTIDGAALKTAASFDFEGKSSYTVRVRSTDQGGLSTEKVFLITVINVNEGPTDIALSAATVAENQPSGTTVGTLTTTDADTGNTFTYTLVSGEGSADNGSFTIDEAALKTAASFNFELKSSYSVRVKSMDQGGLSTEKVFTITVTNVNEAPTDIAVSGTSVAENQPSGTAVGTFTTTDADTGNTFTYTLVSGEGSADNGSFTIDGAALKTAASFDFEGKSSYTVRVRSTDQGGLSTEKVFTITVTNVNEVPTDIALSAATVAENQPSGTAVGTFTTTDPDTGSTFTYTLVSGEGSADNGSFTIDGGVLKTAASFDFESKGSYSVRVKSMDQGGLSTEKVFTITVTNVNEGPTDIALSAATVAENQPSGTAVGTFTTTDPDTGNTFTYTLVSGEGSADNGSFTIDGGVLKTAASFNFEAKSSYSVRVRSADQGGLSTEKAITVGVTDVAAEPLIVQSISAPAAGSYKGREVVTFTVDVSRLVTVTGKPQLEFRLGNATRRATFLGGSGTARLAFQYVVGAKDYAEQVSVGTRIVSANRSIRAGADKLADVLPAGVGGVGLPGVRIDAVAPRVVGRVQVPAKAAYRVGQTLDFAVTYSENVFVTGVPAILLNGMAGGARQATYLSGAGTNRLTFRYVVQSGDALAGKKGLSLGRTISLVGSSITDRDAKNPAAVGITAPSLSGITIAAV